MANLSILCRHIFAFVIQMMQSKFRVIFHEKMSSLDTVRDALLIARYEKIIDDVDFALLYEANLSRPAYPYNKFDRFDIDAWDDSECRTDLRFGKQDLDLLRTYLQIPDEIVCSQRSVCEGMEGLCILLKRLAYPCRYTDMVPRFGRNPTELCLIFNEVLDLVYANHSHRLQNWDLNPFLQPDQLHRYAEAIHLQGAPLTNCFGFIDGTVRSIARPKHNQRVMYNRHKRVHGIKFQSVVTPNGLIANLSGPFEGKRHDSTMLHESGLLNDLRRVPFHNGQPLCLYGDPAYPLGVHLQAPFKGNNLTPQMELYNKSMSEVRVAVEMLFGNISNYFKFIDFKRQMKVNLSPLGKIYFVCALLENAQTCLYGNQVSQMFEIDPPIPE